MPKAPALAMGSSSNNLFSLKLLTADKIITIDSSISVPRGGWFNVVVIVVVVVLMSISNK